MAWLSMGGEGLMDPFKALRGARVVRFGCELFVNCVFETSKEH